MKRKIRDFYLINQIITAIFFNMPENVTLILDYLLSQYIKGKV